MCRPSKKRLQVLRFARVEKTLAQKILTGAVGLSNSSGDLDESEPRSEGKANSNRSAATPVL